jgi:subtilase-type serine protease
VQSIIFSAGCRKSALLLSLSSLALLTACGGGDGDGGGTIDDFYTIAADPGGSGTLGSYYMAALTQEWRDAAASFRDNNPRFEFQSGTVTLPGGGTAFSNPLFSSRVDYAHALGLSGAGEVIAVVDAGFRQAHEAFAGKTNTSTGSPGLDDHGTMVASIAAGNSSQMVGVAPGANIIFSDWGDDSVSDLTAAANAARTRGAVAQNNSWGFDGLYVNQSSYNLIFGSTEGAAWLAAIRNYALGFGSWDGGVVVFAVDNVDNGVAGLLDGLPYFSLQSDLEKAWLAVGNAVPTFNDNDVTGGTLISSPCYQSGAWCMVADGYWVAATATSTSSYDSGTGSSFAAPQVSGALALLAEAFPNLTPHQLRARLLASADNTFSGFVSAGSVDLLDGPGEFLHDYSSDFGHGFLDIRAALMPIGQTVLSTGSGGKITTEDFAFSTGGAMGDAVTRGLDGVELTVTDALEGGFDVAAKSFVSSAKPGDLAETLAARSYGKDYGAARRAPVNPLADTFAAHAGRTLELNGPDDRTKAAVLLSGSDTYGIAVSRTVTEGDLKVDIGVKVSRDDGRVMGFSDASGGGADMAAVTLALSHDIGTGGFFALSGEIGVADMATPAAMASVSTADFNSVSLDIGSRSVFAKGDRLSVGVSMPIAVTSGSASMMVPVALGEGRSEIRSLAIDLAPTERQIDVSIGYQMPMSDRSEFLLEVVHAENYGNQAGFTDQAALIGMKWSF